MKGAQQPGRIDRRNHIDQSESRDGAFFEGKRYAGTEAWQCDGMYIFVEFDTLVEHDHSNVVPESGAIVEWVPRRIRTLVEC